MSRESSHAPQLPLFVHDTVGYPEALTRYEAIRPVLVPASHWLADSARGAAHRAPR